MDELDNLVGEMIEFPALGEDILSLTRSEVDKAIKYNEIDPVRIGYVFDNLLELAAAGIGDNEFRRLVDYYAKVNRPVAELYSELYSTVKS